MLFLIAITIVTLLFGGPTFFIWAVVSTKLPLVYLAYRIWKYLNK